MEPARNFGELLISALEEAVAYKQGKRPDVRVTRHLVRGDLVEPDRETRPRKKQA